MKKLVTALIVLTLTLGIFASCGNTIDNDEAGKMKVGLICLHDENSTYDDNFIEAFKAACKAQNVKAVVEVNVPESETAYNKAVSMVDDGVKLVFADSFGHEEYILNAAKEYSDVQFCHATGTMAHTAETANFHNAFASIYEGRYLAGVAAGAKLVDMLNNGKLTDKNFDADGNIIVGYVGAFTYAEVISGYTSWFLGVRNTVEEMTDKSVSMKVQFTGSWYKEAAERSAANALIEAGAALVSQHADSWGAPTACETAGIPNVSYNGSTESRCPNTFIISSRINWQPYFEYCIQCVKNGTAIDTDWSQGLGTTYKNGSVCITDLGKKAPADGTQALIDAAAAKIRDGSLKVFDCSTFTVGEKNLTSYTADVDTDPAYTPDTEAILQDGDVYYFAESKYRSAPYFDLRIDGITLLNEVYDPIED